MHWWRVDFIASSERFWELWGYLTETGIQGCSCNGFSRVVFVRRFSFVMPLALLPLLLPLLLAVWNAFIEQRSWSSRVNRVEFRFCVRQGLTQRKNLGFEREKMQAEILRPSHPFMANLSCPPLCLCLCLAAVSNCIRRQAGIPGFRFVKRRYPRTGLWQLRHCPGPKMKSTQMNTRTCCSVTEHLPGGAQGVRSTYVGVTYKYLARLYVIDVCLRIPLYTPTTTHTYTYLHLHIPIPTNTCTYTYTQRHLHIPIPTDIPTHIYTYTYLHLHITIPTHIPTPRLTPTV